MLSDETFNFLSSKPDVDDHEIDALVKYAATQRPDVWMAIRVMHKHGQDHIVPEYLMMLNDQKLTALGKVLTYLWARFDAYEKRMQQLEAEADAQPEAMRQQMSLQEMMARTSHWMRGQSPDVGTATICRAIEATVRANMIRCKQDWAGLVRLIRDEGAWMPELTNGTFIGMVADHCAIDDQQMPSASALKVLSFGKQKFPAWNVTDYDPSQTKSLVDMAAYFLQEVDKLVQNALSKGPNKPFAI